MAGLKTTLFEGRLAAVYSLVSCLGFATDWSVLTGLEHLGMEPAWARVISLFAAMQVTFWVNGLFVFRCLTRKSAGGAWLAYTVTNGFGNFCNYWVFVTLVSLHNPIWSNRLLGLVIGGLVAWAINYGCARFLIFGVKKPGKEECVGIGEVVAGLSARWTSFRAGTPPSQPH